MSENLCLGCGEDLIGAAINKDIYFDQVHFILSYYNGYCLRCAERACVNRFKMYSKDIVEATLVRQAFDQRILAAFKKRVNTAAGTRILAL